MPKITNADLTSNSPVIKGDERVWGAKLNYITELTEDKLNEIITDLNYVTGTVDSTELSYLDGVTSGIQAQLNNKQALDSDLTAIADLATTGIIVRTGGGTATTRNIATSGVGISVTNGDGVRANPTVVSNATSSNTPDTIVSRNADGNFTAGTITATINGSASTITTPRTIGTMTGDVTSGGSNFDGSENNTNVATIGANKVTKSVSLRLRLPLWYSVFQLFQLPASPLRVRNPKPTPFVS